MTNEALVSMYFLFTGIAYLAKKRGVNMMLNLFQGSILISQAFIVLLFWIFLARVFFKGNKSYVFYYYMVYRHIGPFLFMLSDFLLSRSKLLKSSLAFVLIYTFIYTIVLVDYQKQTGKILYRTPFTDFQSNPTRF